MRELKIFSGGANPDLAAKICRHLNIKPGRITLSKFPDGENHVKIEEDVRGRDVFVVQPTSPPVNDNLFELLTILDCCRRASAGRITAVIPYYGYARQDRKDEGRVPITAKLVANLIVRAGADRVLAMDLHAAQIQGFFDVPVDHLYAQPVITDHFVSRRIDPEELVVVSPDEGSIKRALGHSKRLGGTLAIVDKRRRNALEVRQDTIIGGPVKDRIAVMFDDMISTAGSICGAANLVHQQGAREIHIAATHGVFCGPALQRLRDAPIDSITITDTIPSVGDDQLPGLMTLSVAPLLAEAIKRTHQDQSISELFRERE